jgi:hypothetical protein
MSSQNGFRVRVLVCVILTLKHLKIFPNYRGNCPVLKGPKTGNSYDLSALNECFLAH